MSNARATVGIGEAARRVGLAPSAIRFYESEGLLAELPRDGGRRRYGSEELRRLAFVAVGRSLGLGLAAIRAALHPEPGDWPRIVDEQVTLLDARIAEAEHTRALLLASRDCPTPQPVRDCEYLRGALDERVGAPS
ncbi:MerR family transcriptional regulator [Pseudonocardia sp. GCM10023141]|uniref:helix-turn-helix domain-containing protein n=1 Tax=Pseudonocardia sp. GCM10023141 TaxID=3252653 RepID=UPI003615D476